MYSARHLAMTRMEEEADQLGADGIVGVRLEIGRYEWGANMAEFIAIGTAVKHRDGVLHRAPNGRPFQSDLSGQEFWTLLRTGHRPVGMVMGNCVYHVGRRGPLRTLAQTGRNVELPNFTQALYDARELAMQRMQTEAQDLGPRASSGCRSSERSHGWGSHVIEFFAIGTAIIPTDERRRDRAPDPGARPQRPLNQALYASECWSVSPNAESSSDGAPGSLSAESLCDPPSAPGSSG